MKNIILAVCVFASILACKKKKNENPVPEPVILMETVTGSENALPGCQAKTITETEGGNVVSLVKIGYANGLPANIKIDSAGQEKINLILDDKGSIKSGTLPIPYGGNNINVSFKSANTYDNGLLIKAVQTATLYSLINVTITNNYTYDGSSNLTLLLRTTIATVLFTGSVEQSLKDSIVYFGYSNGRPASLEKHSKDVKAGTSYKLSSTESYAYDSNMNRIKIYRNDILREETVFSSELFPGKIAYLMDLDGNPNYGNKNQDLNFIQTQKTYKNCSTGTIYDISNVTAFQKSGSCIANATLADTTAVCGASGTPSSKNYVIVY